MKILFFGTYFYPYLSGITTYPLLVLSHLAKKHEVTALAFNHVRNSYAEESINGIQVKRMPYLFKVSKGFISLQSWRHFWKDAWKNDVIFLNFPNAEGLMLAVLGKIFRKKIVGIFHCRVFLGEDLVSKVIEILLNSCVWLQMALTDKIVIYTDDYFQNLQWERIFDKKVLQVYPPVSMTTAEKSAKNEYLEKKGKKQWIGFVGRVSKEKGLEYLVQALSTLGEKNNIELVLAGPFGSQVVGEDAYYEKIKNLLKEFHIPHTFYGPLSGGRLTAFYECLDVLVLPSVNKTEAFGMVQVEAMMAGTPVIASDLPGVRVPIQETKMGVIVSPKNSEKLKLALEKVLSSRHLYSDATLQQRAREIFESKRVFLLYDKLIQKL